jgi:hypothetical protein
MFLPQSDELPATVFKSRVPNPSDGKLMSKWARVWKLKDGGHTIERYVGFIREDIFKFQPGQMYIFHGHPMISNSEYGRMAPPPKTYEVSVDIRDPLQRFSLPSPVLSIEEKRKYIGSNMTAVMLHKRRLCLALYLWFTDAGTFINPEMVTKGAGFEEEMAIDLSGAMGDDFESFYVAYKAFIAQQKALNGDRDEVCLVVKHFSIL